MTESGGVPDHQLPAGPDSAVGQEPERRADEGRKEPEPGSQVHLERAVEENERLADDDGRAGLERIDPVTRLVIAGEQPPRIGRGVVGGDLVVRDVGGPVREAAVKGNRPSQESAARPGGPP